MQLHKILILCLLILSCQPVKNPTTPELWKVTKVVDGDTFYALGPAGEPLKIRLIGLDAPETRKTGKKETGYYGKESSNYLHEILENRFVILEFDLTRIDQYGRTLAYVFLEDGTFVNAELVKRGFARVMTIPPNVKYADEFLKLQRKARRQERGLWGETIIE